jgi:hypothetical protein
MAGFCSYLTICLHVKSDGTLIILKFLYKKPLLLQVEFFKNLWTERAWGGGLAGVLDSESNIGEWNCEYLLNTENKAVCILRIWVIKPCV